MPSVGTSGDLRAALLAAPAIFLPDPTKATAGIHFARVLRQLGIFDEVAASMRPYPNGALAMASLGRTSAPSAAPRRRRSCARAA